MRRHRAHYDVSVMTEKVVRHKVQMLFVQVTQHTIVSEQNNAFTKLYGKYITYSNNRACPVYLISRGYF